MYGRLKAWTRGRWSRVRKLDLRQTIVDYFTYFRIHFLYIFLLSLIGSIAIYLIEKRRFAFIDCLFTAISSTCVCGLITIDTSELSVASQVVAFILILCGGHVIMSTVPVIIRRYYFEKKAHETIDDEDLRLELLEQQSTEYRSLGYVITFAIAYWLSVQLIVFFMLGFYTAFAPGAREVLDANGVNSWWFSAFMAASSFANAGMSILPDSLVPLHNDRFILLTIAGSVSCGMVSFPVIFRFLIWTAHRIKPKEEAFKFLLERPRKCYTHMFRAVVTYQLMALIVMFTLLDFFVFLGQEFNDESLTDYSKDTRALVGFFQAVVIRMAGFNAIDVSLLSAGVQVLYALMMYLSVYPVLFSIRSTSESNMKSHNGYHHPITDMQQAPPSIGRIGTISSATGDYGSFVGFKSLFQQPLDTHGTGLIAMTSPTPVSPSLMPKTPDVDPSALAGLGYPKHSRNRGETSERMVSTKDQDPPNINAILSQPKHNALRRAQTTETMSHADIDPRVSPNSDINIEPSQWSDNTQTNPGSNSSNIQQNPEQIIIPVSSQDRDSAPKNTKEQSDLDLTARKSLLKKKRKQRTENYERSRREKEEVWDSVSPGEDRDKGKLMKDVTQSSSPKDPKQMKREMSRGNMSGYGTDVSSEASESSYRRKKYKRKYSSRNGSVRYTDTSISRSASQESTLEVGTGFLNPHSMYVEDNSFAYSHASEAGHPVILVTPPIPIQVMSLLGRDLSIMFISLFVIALIQKNELNPASDVNNTTFSLWGVTFELCSAYGTVGLSLGYPGTKTSLSGQLAIVSKLIVILVILLGRHRGLASSIDPAVYLPSIFNKSVTSPQPIPPEPPESDISSIGQRTIIHKGLRAVKEVADMGLTLGRNMTRGLTSKTYGLAQPLQSSTAVVQPMIIDGQPVNLVQTGSLTPMSVCDVLNNNGTIRLDSNGPSVLTLLSGQPDRLRPRVPDDRYPAVQSQNNTVNGGFIGQLYPRNALHGVGATVGRNYAAYTVANVHGLIPPRRLHGSQQNTVTSSTFAKHDVRNRSFSSVGLSPNATKRMQPVVFRTAPVATGLSNRPAVAYANTISNINGIQYILQPPSTITGNASSIVDYNRQYRDPNLSANSNSLEPTSTSDSLNGVSRGGVKAQNLETTNETSTSAQSREYDGTKFGVFGSPSPHRVIPGADLEERSNRNAKVPHSSGVFDSGQATGVRPNGNTQEASQLLHNTQTASRGVHPDGPLDAPPPINTSLAPSGRDVTSNKVNSSKGTQGGSSNAYKDRTPPSNNLNHKNRRSTQREDKRNDIYADLDTFGREYQSRLLARQSQNKRPLSIFDIPWHQALAGMAQSSNTMPIAEGMHDSHETDASGHISPDSVTMPISVGQSSDRSPSDVSHSDQ